jgi:hypothetical protein
MTTDPVECNKIIRLEVRACLPPINTFTTSFMSGIALTFSAPGATCEHVLGRFHVYNIALLLQV